MHILVLSVQTGRLCDALERSGICSWWHFSFAIYIVNIGCY